MKSAKPHKEPAPELRQETVKPSESSTRPRRPSYPPDVLSHEGNVEFLRSVAEICNARADEVEQAKSKKHHR
jgi:hypothetical protein